MVNALDEERYMSGPLIKWMSGAFMFNQFGSGAFENFFTEFTHRYLSAPGSDGDAAANTAQHNEAPTPLPTFDSWAPAPLLKEWAKAALASGEWKDALVVAASVSISPLAPVPLLGLTLMGFSSHFPESQFIGPYVNVWKRSTVQRMQSSVSSK